MKRIGIAVCIGMIAASCGSNSSPTTPTPTPTPAPTATTFTLSGHVTSSANGAAISGARVAVADGPNAGRSTTTDGSGAYSLTSLTQSGFTVGFSATNFNSVSKPANLITNLTLDAQLDPTPLFTQSGVGNNVFSVPSTVSRMRITGTYTGFSSNFVVWVGPQGVACGNVLNGSCSLLVNDLIGTGYGKTTSDGVYQMPGTTQVNILLSSGVSWTFTEVR